MTGIVPKGSVAGLQFEDLGEDVKEGAEGLMRVFRQHFRWDAGLTLRDWRYVVRIANIDKSELNKAASGNSADLADLMFQAEELLPPGSMGTPVFYMARDMRTMLRRQLADHVKQSVLSVAEVGGVKTDMFAERIPMRRVDALSIDEVRVQ